jgi:hypothetical protein
VLGWEAQVHGERGEVVLQAGDHLGVGLAVAGGELAGAAGRLGDGPFAGSLLDVVEDRPERRLDLGLGPLGQASTLCGSDGETTLAQARAERSLQRRDQARGAVTDAQQRRA